MPLLGGAAAGSLFKPPLEALDTSARVDELLLARIERVALRADLDVQLRFCGASDERVSARAMHGRKDVIGVNFGLHRAARIAEAVWLATLPPLMITTGFSASTLPERSAATAAAAAGSQASFVRS